MKQEWIQPLKHAENTRRFGGKAASIAHIFRAGVESAPGFVLGTELLQDHLTRLGLIANTNALFLALERGEKETALSIADALRQKLLEAELAPALLSALQTRIAPGQQYAVRSSAVGEDGIEDSFAGQFDSVLGCVSVVEIATAIRQVWASLFGKRAILYAFHRKNFSRDMAVIVQQQVDAVVSGVMFTRDPRHEYADCALIEYCAGLGEELVSGHLVPGRVRLDRNSKAVSVEQEPDHEVALPPTDTVCVTRLLDSARCLEDYFKTALDIEWSIDTSGALIVLQARPITAMHTSEPKVIWSNANIAENFPDPVCPMLRSFVGRGYAAYFRSLGKAFGISKKRMALMREPLDHITGVHAGRLYYNLSNIHTVLHLAPGGAWLARFFNQFTGAEDFPEPAQVHSPKLIRWIETLNVAIQIVRSYLNVERKLKKFETNIDRFAAASDPRQLQQKEAEELGLLLNGFLDIRLNHWTGGALADTAAMVCYGILKLTLRKTDPNDLLKGLPGLASAVPVEQLWNLSRSLREDAALAEMVRREDAEVVLDQLESGAFPDFYQQLSHYFDHWGFRYSGELMLSQETPMENPLPVLRLLKSYIAMEGGGPAEISQRQATAREEATREIRKELGLLRGALFSVVLKATQGAIRLRERARMKQALLYTRLRHLALALGDRAVQQEQLERANDILFLTIDEAIGLSRGESDIVHSATQLITSRRAELEADFSLTPPDKIELPPDEQWQPGNQTESIPNVGDENTLTGTGACGGNVVGTAAVVLDVADIDRIRSDQLLVTRQTDPGWAAVFFMIKGLVIERGGMLSHGAIIAREYGIPAVVGVRNATRLIEDGQTIRICGDEGRVEHVSS